MTCVKGDNPNYYVDMNCQGHGVRIICEMPEQITGGITSDWESLLPYKLSNLLGGAIGSLANSFAVVPQQQLTSFQSWMGTSPIELPLQLQFDAKEDAFEDVFKPIMTLKALGAPVNGSGGYLWAPGPVGFGNSVTGTGYGIDVRLGKMLFLKDCILRSANETFNTMLDERGYPISGEIELTFSSSYVLGHVDILNAAGIPVQ